MKIVVDTNIFFSAILNTNGKIGDLLLNSDDVFQFYSHNKLLAQNIRKTILTADLWELRQALRE